MHQHQYWVGPFLGSLLGASFYATLKQYVNLLEISGLLLTLSDDSYKYWRLNPDQATSDFRKSPSDPVAMLKSTAETFVRVGDEETHNRRASNEGGVRARGVEESRNITSSRANFSPV